MSTRRPWAPSPWPWRQNGWEHAWAWAREGLPHALERGTWLAPAAFDALAQRAPTPLHAAAARILALLHRDPGMRRAYRHDPTWAALEAAGVFDDGVDAEQTRRWREGCAGFERTAYLPRPAQQGKHDLILMATGGFAPVHEGHLQMMRLAVARATEAGYRVIGLVFSPAHDLYVRTKPLGQLWPIEARLAALHQGAAQLEQELQLPVLVDAWEGRTVAYALNFTTVLARYRAIWMRLHPGRTVRVGLIAGADNAGFAHTATRDHPVFVVGRPGWPLPALPRGGFACAQGVDVASRVLRAQGHTPPLATPKGEGTYAVRDDLTYALQPWRGRVPEATLQAAGRAWRAAVLDSLAQAVAPLPVEVLNVEGQQQWLEAFAQTHPVLTLDPVTHVPCAKAWPRTRRFRAGDGQVRPMYHGPRPQAPLPEPLTPGAYWLVDDDIASGSTMAAVRQTLPQDVQVAGEISLMHQVRRSSNLPIVDVVDLRDFLPGSQDGGLLMVDAYGDEWRAPYMSEWVDLTTRASIAPERVARTRELLWKAASAFFMAIGEPMPPERG